MLFVLCRSQLSRYVKKVKENFMGIFGDLFDFDGDGKLDSFEKAAEFGMFMDMVESCEQNELESAGLDVDELSLMDDDERTEALEDAGFDANCFDF